MTATKNTRGDREKPVAKLAYFWYGHRELTNAASWGRSDDTPSSSPTHNARLSVRCATWQEGPGPPLHPPGRGMRGAKRCVRYGFWDTSKAVVVFPPEVMLLTRAASEATGEKKE